MARHLILCDVISSKLGLHGFCFNDVKWFLCDVIWCLTWALCASSWGPRRVRSSGSTGVGIVTAVDPEGVDPDADPLFVGLTRSVPAILRPPPELPLRRRPAPLLRRRCPRFREPLCCCCCCWLVLLLLLFGCAQLLPDVERRSKLWLGSGIEVTPSLLLLERLKYWNRLCFCNLFFPLFHNDSKYKVSGFQLLNVHMSFTNKIYDITLGKQKSLLRWNNLYFRNILFTETKTFLEWEFNLPTINVHCTLIEQNFHLKCKGNDWNKNDNFALNLFSSFYALVNKYGSQCTGS